jgi:hypothetical protein
MRLNSASQGPLWDKLALYGIRSKSTKLGWNRYDGYLFAKGAARVLVVRDGAPTGESAPAPKRRLRRADKRRGFNARGELLAGWILLPCGIATYDGA